MDPQQIKAFIDAMASSDLAEMEVSHEGWTLRLVRHAGGAGASPSSERPIRQPPPVRDQGASHEHDAGQAARGELRAPLYGVVHLQASPGEPPFVSAGAAVKAGQTLCVIEAMKVFNEVRADHDATVDAVLVVSGQEVEAGQPLLRLV
ncbi:MAG TPA: acetyl-CoA carboxylase biotin carboxyl carrier protein subunit [Ramlibacter sp.]|nr:acetyl-CoA carboxylase biotin carboxyl carrier protein subunit [Ramlibacter sp.]